MKQLVYTVALLMIAFSLNGHAFVNNFPDEIIVKNTQTQLSFTVTNTENIARKLSIEISAPTEFEYLEKPATILAGQTKQVKIVFYPKDNLNGSVFNAKATIKLGINNAEKNFTMSFLNENSCPIEIDTTITKGQNNEYTIFSEVKNQKNSDVSFNLQTITGLPNDWSFNTQNTVLLAPLETRVIQTTINAQSNFEGNAEIIFECENFVKKTQVYIKHENTTPTGLFSLGFLQGQDNGGAGLFNAFLVAIAAVLLLMFISRLVRILAEKNQVQPAYTMMAHTPEKETKQEKKEIRIYQKADPKLENIKKLVTQKKAKGKK